MSALAEYYDLLLPELPGCPIAMLDLNLRETARDFCNTTSVWRESLAPISLIGGQAQYAMVAPANSEVLRVTSVTVKGVLLWVDEHDADCKYNKYEPPFTLSADMAQITLDPPEVPAGSVVNEMVVIAALKPTNSAATLPDFLLKQYSEAIRFGTLSRLMRMAKKPWTDRELAFNYESRWNAERNFAAYQGAVGNNRRPLRVRNWG